MGKKNMKLNNTLQIKNNVSHKKQPFVICILTRFFICMPSSINCSFTGVQFVFVRFLTFEKCHNSVIKLMWYVVY